VSYIPVQCIHETDTLSAESGLDGRYEINLPDSMFVDVKQAEKHHLPSDFYLEQNYPNPFNPTTTIQFNIPQNATVHLAIYNILGQRVKTLVDEACPAGIHAVVWDASDQTGQGVSAGLYFYCLRAGDYTNVKKMILLDGAIGAQRSMLQPVVQIVHKPQPLFKSNSDFVTIRAKSARIQPFEQTKVPVTREGKFFGIDVTLLDVSGFDKDRVLVSKPDPNSEIYVYGLPMAVVDSLSGKETVTITNNRTSEKVAVDVETNGGFPIIAISGEYGDTLSFRLFSQVGTEEEHQIGETLELSVYCSSTPQVCATSPSNGDKDIIVDAEIIVRFTIPMDITTITRESFLLSSKTGNVDGSISFDDNTTARFIPDQPLVPSTTYIITLTTNVTSMWGVPLQEDFVSSFTTLTTGTVAQQLQKTLDEQLEVFGLTGLSAAIVFPDQSVWLGASGMSDPIHNDSMRTDMILNTGGIGSNFTATVVLQLVEEGRLSLEDSLHKWLPTLPNIDNTITVRQLLNHTSGLYHIGDNPSLLPAVLSDLDKHWTYEEILRTFIKLTPFSPGIGVNISSTNYLLLSWIIEEVTSTYFPIEMENRLGNLSLLDHTYFTWSDTISEAFAHP
jgi:hypothetical protein